MHPPVLYRLSYPETRGIYTPKEEEEDHFHCSTWTRIWLTPGNQGICLSHSTYFTFSFNIFYFLCKWILKWAILEVDATASTLSLLLGSFRVAILYYNLPQPVSDDLPLSGRWRCWLNPYPPPLYYIDSMRRGECHYYWWHCGYSVGMDNSEETHKELISKIIDAFALE